MGLNLYSKVEPYLDFDDAIIKLHKEFLSFVFENDCDNILDIGCGQGYFLENLNINGKKSFGIDLSSHQIQACKNKGIENCECIDLSKVEKKYDCATAIFDVINYICPNDLQKFFNDTSKALNENAYFIFDMNSLFGFEEVAQGSINLDVDDKFIAIDANFEEEELQTDITLFSQNKNKSFTKESDSITQYYYDSKTLSKLLENAGFKVQKIKEISLHDFGESDKSIFICKK